MKVTPPQAETCDSAVSVFVMVSPESSFPVTGSNSRMTVVLGARKKLLEP